MSSGSVSVEGFIHAMSLAWKQLWVYPAGHPARAGAVGRAFDVLEILVAPTGELTLGVDKGALVCAGDRLTDTNAQQLAHQLFQRNVALVRFEEGVRAGDLEGWLELLNPDQGKRHTARLWDEAAAAGVRNVVMEPVDFSGVEATADLDAEFDPRPEKRTPQTLWQRILDRLLEGQGAPRAGSGSGGGGGGLGQVVQLLRNLITEGDETVGGTEGGPGDSAEQKGAIVQRRRQRMAHLSEHLAAAVSGHLGSTETDDPKEAQLRQVAELVKALPAAMRPRVIDAAARKLASEDDSTAGLKMLAASSSAAAVVGSLRRIQSEGLEFSEHALQAIDALAWREAGGVEREEDLSAEAQDSLAREMSSFLEAEDLDTLPGSETPDRRLLEVPNDVALQTEIPPEVENERRSLSERIQTRTLSLTLLELIGRTGDASAADPLIERLETVFASLVAGRQLTSADAIVSALRAMESSEKETEAARGAATRALRRLTGPTGTAAVVDYVSGLRPDEFERAQGLVGSFGGPMLRSLITALSEEEDMTRRRRLLAFLGSLGSDVSGLAVTALSDSRWFVVRNMLGLLREVGDTSAVPAVRQAFGHENSKVRVEALKTLGQLDDDPPRDLIERALADPDPQVAELATTTLAGHGGAGMESLVELLLKKDPLGRQRSLRVKAFKTLGQIGDPRALKSLKRYSNWFFVVDSLAERRAAFEALDGYPPEARRAWLKKGRRIKDPEIKAVCRRLWAQDSGSGGDA